MEQENHPSFRDLFSLHEKYVDFLLGKTHLSHQYLKNISSSGREVEWEIREIFSSLLPDRFYVTHGYIAFAKSREEEPVISQQIDIIIVDRMVPHTLFTFGKSIEREKGVEVVPVECVVGIFEVKRTLNTKTMEGAVKYLQDVTKKLGITCDNGDGYFVGGIKAGSSFTGQLYSNPLVGVIGAAHEEELYKSISTGEGGGSELSTFKKNKPVNIVFSLQGLVCYRQCPSGSVSEHERATLVPETRPGEFSLMPIENTSEAQRLAMAFGVILKYLSRTSGRQLNVENYFLNNCLGEV